MRYFVPLAALSLLLSTSLPAFSYRDAAVLGSSTEITDAVFPPVTSGPGHILPDSPFYFLDKLYQDFRLALVFTPANKARLRLAIGGERLAELRVESSRNNQVGVDAALLELEHQSMAAANDVRDAAAKGENVTQLARDVHQTMTDYGNILAAVQAQVPDTAYEQKLATAGDVLWEARILSEDALPESDLKHEIMANVNTELDKAVLGVSTSTDKLEHKLNIYEKMASNSGNKNMALDKQIAELRKKITVLQAQLDRLLLIQKQLGQTINPSQASKPGSLKVPTPTRKPSPTLFPHQ